MLLSAAVAPTVASTTVV